jgi:hypothetical protein
MGNCNLADLGTRPTVVPGDLSANSDYQEGMAWMKEPEEKWPCKRSIGVAPKEKMRKDILAAICNMASAAPPTDGGQVQFPVPSKGCLDKLVRIYGYSYWLLFTSGGRRQWHKGLLSSM